MNLYERLYYFFKKLQASAPWSRWEVLRGYPDSQVFELKKLLLWIHLPTYDADLSVRQQGGKMDLGRWTARVGVWASRLAGGTEEIGIAISQILYTFRDTSVCTATKFDVTLGTAYTNKSLLDLGLSVQGIGGPFEVLKNTDTNEFRYEFDLYLKG